MFKNKAINLSSPLVVGEKVLNLLLFPDVWLVNVEDIKDDPEFGFDPDLCEHSLKFSDSFKNRS